MSAPQKPLQAEILEVLTKSGEPLTRVEIVDMLKHRLDANSHSINSRLNNLVRALHVTVSENDAGRKMFRAIAGGAAEGQSTRRRKAPAGEGAPVPEQQAAAESEAIVSGMVEEPADSPPAATTPVARKPRKPAKPRTKAAPKLAAPPAEQFPTMVPFKSDLYEHVGQSMTDLEDLVETAIREDESHEVLLGLLAANANLRRVQNAIHRSIKAR